MPSNRKKFSGFSLIEALAVMALFSLFLLITLPYLTTTSTLLRNIKSEEELELVTTRVFQTINNAISASSSFFAIKSLIIHPSQEILTFDNQQAFKKQLAKYPIDRENQPLSAMQIIKEYPISINSSQNSGESSQFFGCALNSTTSITAYKFYSDQHWLILTINGHTTMQGRIVYLKNNFSCRQGSAVRLDLTTTDHPIFATISMPLNDNSTFLIYPIEEEFSIYLDSKGDLRKLFHRSLVNQKILSRIDFDFSK